MSHAIKSILTMLDRPADMQAILGWANRLAKDFDAAADGVFLKYAPAPNRMNFAAGFGYYTPDIAERELAEASAQAEEAAHEEFECAAKRNARSRMGRLQVVADGLRGELARLSRHYDLALIHLPQGETSSVDETLLAELLLEGGVPVFAAPRMAQGDSPLQTALVAWDGSLEASRSLRAALPLLKECRVVHVRSVTEGDVRKDSMSSISRYLELHGVEVDIGRVKPDGGAGDALLKEADKLAADFIVMGAFGHRPWREQLFGGATHDVVRASRKPLFLAH